MIVYARAQGCSRMETNKANVKRSCCVRVKKRRRQKYSRFYRHVPRGNLYASFVLRSSFCPSFRSVSFDCCACFGPMFVVDLNVVHSNSIRIHLNCDEMSKYNEIYLSRAHVRCQKGKVPSLHSLHGICRLPSFSFSFCCFCLLLRSSVR